MTPLPRARTFKPRRRGLSPARAAAYALASERWGLTVDGPVLVLPEVFGSDGPFVLDIGFGGGEALLALARARPDECVIGVEVHTTGLAAVSEAITAESFSNARIVEGDALDFLPRLAAASLDEIRVWFPDPWPKQRQQHRRLVRPEVVSSLADRLRGGGRLHLATDHVDYSLQMQRVVDACPALSGGVVARPSWRPVTRFESRGLAEGRTPVDLIYVKERD
ncbi:MAG: tRNA (guanosine(46)-N7)-methyltransferase TrmB [Ilumatobacteraceae bacterium]